jgi:hypothetical protein
LLPEIAAGEISVLATRKPIVTDWLRRVREDTADPIGIGHQRQAATSDREVAMSQKLEDIRFMATLSFVVLVGSGLQLLLH